jgi:hypothetical protein
VLGGHLPHAKKAALLGFAFDPARLGPLEASRGPAGGGVPRSESRPGVDLGWTGARGGERPRRGSERAVNFQGGRNYSL